jgi:predicted phosphoribosyltransferase
MVSAAQLRRIDMEDKRMSFNRFADRREAGQILAEALFPYAHKKDILVLALPRGGVPVAYEVAKILHAPMDLWIVRKLGVPGHEELAMGALAGEGLYVLNDEVIGLMRIGKNIIDDVMARERKELDRRNKLYRQGRPPPDVTGKTVIVIDDGLATGATMRAALMSLRQAGAARIIAAAPVGAPSTCRDLENDADAVLCLYMPEPFYGVGVWYDDFSQTLDREVQDLLQRT